MDDNASRHSLCIRIKLARSSAKLTQAQLASRLGVHVSAVGHWEVPEGTAPTWHHLYEIASVTGCSVEWLATGTGSRSAQDEHAPREEGGGGQFDGGSRSDREQGYRSLATHEGAEASRASAVHRPLLRLSAPIAQRWNRWARRSEGRSVA